MSLAALFRLAVFSEVHFLPRYVIACYWQRVNCSNVCKQMWWDSPCPEENVICFGYRQINCLFWTFGFLTKTLPPRVHSQQCQTCAMGAEQTSEQTTAWPVGQEGRSLQSQPCSMYWFSHLKGRQREMYEQWRKQDPKIFPYHLQSMLCWASGSYISDAQYPGCNSEGGNVFSPMPP